MTERPPTAAQLQRAELLAHLRAHHPTITVQPGARPTLATLVQVHRESHPVIAGSVTGDAGSPWHTHAAEHVDSGTWPMPGRRYY